MDLKVTAETVEIKPKTSYLSGSDLVRLRHVDVEPVRFGLKRTSSLGTKEEADELEKLYDDLRRQLSVARIERLSGRALGRWDADEQAVLVLRKDGKFGSFGYSREGGRHYLENFEALFLLELGRLQLEFNSLVMSVEQAYLLLLGEESSHQYNEYLVYSNLMRVGYILVKHRNRRYLEQTINSVEDCIWAVLESELRNHTVPDHVRKSQYYSQTKQQFEEIKTQIKEQSSNVAHGSVSGSNSPNLEETFRLNSKRPADSSNGQQQAKRLCGDSTWNSVNSFVDFLKDEPEYRKFRNIFEKFDIIKLKRDQEEDAEGRCLTISFDVYTHSNGFRKSSPKAPIFRILILGPNERFPTHTEIHTTYRTQLCPVPLLIVSINESKQLQAFLYYFT